MSGHLTKDELAQWVGDRRKCDRPGSAPVHIGQVLAELAPQIGLAPAVATETKPQEGKR